MEAEKDSRLSDVNEALSPEPVIEYARIVCVKDSGSTSVAQYITVPALASVDRFLHWPCLVYGITWRGPGSGPVWRDGGYRKPSKLSAIPIRHLAAIRE